MMTFPFTTTRLFLDYDLAPFPNILSYLKRIESRPAYRRAMALAGPRSKSDRDDPLRQLRSSPPSTPSNSTGPFRSQSP